MKNHWLKSVTVFLSALFCSGITHASKLALPLKLQAKAVSIGLFVLKNLKKLVPASIYIQ